MSVSSYVGWRLTVLTLMLAVPSLAVAQGGPPAMPVTVAQPIAKQVTQWDEYSGRFSATESVEVRARVSGFIESVLCRKLALIGSRRGGSGHPAPSAGTQQEEARPV